MFQRKDLINTDSYISIADVAIVEDTEAYVMKKGIIGKLFSGPCKKIYDCTQKRASKEKRLNFNFPNKDEIIFFIKTDFLYYFIDLIRPYLKQRYKIITGNSSYSIPLWDKSDFSNLLHDSLLVTWYGINIIRNHPKLKSVPLGIPTMRALKLGHQFGDNDLFFRELNDFLKSPNQYKNRLIYWGWQGKTNPIRNDIFENIIPNMKSVVTITEKRDYGDYLNDLKQHKFIICPEGSGIDTLRAWESLYYKAIPVVKKNIYTYSYRSNFPILYVNTWSELLNLTDDYLHQKYEEMIAMPYQNKLKFEYWKNLIKGEQ